MVCLSRAGFYYNFCLFIIFNVSQFFFQIFCYPLFPVLPHIVPFDFGDTPVFSGQAAQVTCLVSEGDLPLEIKWNFLGDTMSSLDGVTTTKIGKKGSLLFIDFVTEAHSGNYTCTTKNKAGVVDYTATLSVYGTTVCLYVSSAFLDMCVWLCTFRFSLWFLFFNFALLCCSSISQY